MEKKQKQTKKKHVKSEKKKLIIYLSIIAIVFIIIIGLAISFSKKQNGLQNETGENSYVEEIENGVKINTGSKLNESKLVNGLLISNIQLTERDGMTTLLANVKNTNETKTEFKKLKIILLDENENELISVTAFLGEINAGETTQLNTSMTSNFVNAYDFKVVEE